MTNQEIKIEDISTLPESLYHLVPKKLFDKFTDDEGNYDCRNKEEWGKKSPFIHTSPTKKQLKERVADMNWVSYPMKEKFLLLEINPLKIKAKITYAIISGNTYHHIWGALPKDSFIILKVNRSQDGKFLI
ncbi:MAG: hypothetical protein UV36_C0004G0019 [Parcubacteria group bacterium GW2011_GWC2_42_6]|nr:MAG: hypothetical protein UU87_C0003G0122 [Parcubacteria group bacterium GW2011_GWA2_42_11]KKS67694.1 MAG: hypothetical protein UV36_C0004G0019 [Parcubacteria group bacterium GW2011_GWC2_42_6]KKT76450.1 MAG: hypothetical protein UW72_C0005G0018 [Parcubacteria group bacterium GW2011_GWF2_44_7]